MITIYLNARTTGLPNDLELHPSDSRIHRIDVVIENKRIPLTLLPTAVEIQDSNLITEWYESKMVQMALTYVHEHLLGFNYLMKHPETDPAAVL